jgi:hypothetical protein
MEGLNINERSKKEGRIVICTIKIFVLVYLEMLNHSEGHFTTWTVLLLSFFPMCCYVEDTIFEF